MRKAVASDYAVIEDFLTGSYRRHTLIAPLSEADIDIVIVLEAKYFEQNGQAKLLDGVRDTLRKTYPNSPRISRNGQAVTITFSDFKVDVVPGFARRGGGYLIPDSIAGRWIETDPKRHVAIWTDQNRTHEGALVPLMKMLKCWNRAHSSTLRSFHLEVLVLETLRSVTISDFPSGARFVFDRARPRVLMKDVLDPAGYAGSVGSYLDTTVKQMDVYARLESALQQARDAERLDANGFPGDAIGKWGTIFGDDFPAYG